MKLSRIQQIIKEEVAKAVSEIDKNRELSDKFAAAVGFEPTASGPENTIKEKPPGYDKLPDTRENLDWDVYVKLPNLPASDASIHLMSKKEVDDWIEKFKSKYNEQPRFIETQYGLSVANDAFQADRKEYINGKSRELEKYKGKD